MPIKSQKFWNFSIDLYNREGVAAACLQLQEECQLDVNLLLFCYWYGSAFGVLEGKLLQQAIDYSADWRLQVVQPLRNIRNWLKTNQDQSEQLQSLRTKIKAEELSAEKYQQERLEDLTSGYRSMETRSSRHEDIEINIDMLMDALGINRNRDVNNKLERIKIVLEDQLPAKR